MPPKHRLTASQDTPNPSARRFSVDPPLPPPTSLNGRPRSYAAPAPPADDPMAAALLALPGVTRVLIAPDGCWLTLTKDAAARWDVLTRALESALAQPAH
ncbi:MAG: NifU N-terminal domain-containing protein [bacterium]|nr:NifU N-terminal domain-containing protein [Planctomycetaceae bacterium]